MAYSYPFRFEGLERVRFVSRPNRFLVRCRRDDGRVVEAFMPNPGRLRELLLPGVALLVISTPGEARKTKHTAVAVERDGAPVFLHTHLNNAAAAHLIKSGRIPGLEDARFVRAEVKVGHSRFDFEIEQGGERRIVEVKSVTLFGQGVAMFPDAVTDRGRRHLLELAEMGSRRRKHVALFLVHTPGVRYFVPDYHTDLAFSRTLYEVRKKVDVLALSLDWTAKLRMRKRVSPLRIPWEVFPELLRDRGACIFVAKAKGASRGVLLHVLEDKNDLTRAIARVRRAAAKGAAPWTDPMALLDVLPIRCGRSLLSDLTPALGGFGSVLPKNLDGAVQIRCSRDPIPNPAFQQVIEDFRMRHALPALDGHESE